jgi:hypothetical protein
MGYYINIINHYVLIPNDQKDAALTTLKAMAENTDQMGGGGHTIGSPEVVKQWFSWVDMNQLADADTLIKAFDAWRYTFSENDDGTAIVLDYFDGEKLGDDAFLWETMAPFIKNGGFLEVHGEEGEFWRWKFNDGNFREVELQLTEVPYQRV